LSKPRLADSARNLRYFDVMSFPFAEIALETRQ
jgi:hypothetical protein